MTQRRALIEGLRNQLPDIDPEAAARFIAGDTPAPAPVNAEPVEVTHRPKIAASPPASVPVRVPLSTRIRSDLFAALKQESLNRQLTHVQPCAIMEILDQAIEAWLKDHAVSALSME